MVAKKITAKKAVKKAVKKTPLKATAKKAVKKTAPKTTAKKAVKKAATKKSAAKKVVKKTISAPKLKKTAPEKPVQKLTFTTGLFTDETHNIEEEMALTKYDIGAHTTYAEYAYDPMKTEEPPVVYYVDRVMILPIDPRFAFMYWEIREDTLNYFLGNYGYDSRLTLRIYDVTNIDFNGYNAHEYWDTEIYNRVGTWYLKHFKGDRSLIVDIGLTSSDGVFHAIARSRSMYFPKDSMVHPAKILWMLVDEFGNKVISEIEDYTDDDLRLLRKLLGDERFKLFLKGGLDVFLGASAWGRLPVIESFLDLAKLPSVSSPGSAWPSSPGAGKRD